jgi:hypothetical protein
MPVRARFRRDTGFHAALKRGATAYFEGTGRSRHGGATVHAKTGTILIWFVPGVPERLGGAAVPPRGRRPRIRAVDRLPARACGAGGRFEAAAPGDQVLPTSWAEHQVRATADFAPHSMILGWYIGGLNFQVEHHLFPEVSHLHYPALSRIVKAACADHGLPYHVQPSLRDAVAAHYRLLLALGRGPGELGHRPRGVVPSGPTLDPGYRSGRGPAANRGARLLRGGRASRSGQ